MSGERVEHGRGESTRNATGGSVPDLSRRRVLGGLGGLAATGLTVGAVGAQTADADVPSPTVEGPVEGGSVTGGPQTAAPIDVTEYGYVEEEYFVSGEARHDQFFFGGENEDETASYRTRVLVYRPESSLQFDGSVLVEWFNVSTQMDAAVAWPTAYESLMGNGTAVALVSAQKVGVDDSALGQDLVTWDPERYGDLSHPGDEYALDIFAQVTRALDADGDGGTGRTGGLWGSGGRGSSSGAAGSSGSGSPWGSLAQIGGSSGSGGGWFGSGGSGTSGGSSGDSSGGSSGGLWGSGGSGGSSGGTGGTGGDPHPLGDLEAETLLATGHSQSGFFLLRYINLAAPTYGLIDGFLPAGAPLTTARADVAPVLWFNSEDETGTLQEFIGDGEDDVPGEIDLPQSGLRVEEATPGPREDEGLFTLWEVAGASHVNVWLSQWSAAKRARDFQGTEVPFDPEAAGQYGELPDGTYGECDFNYFPARFAWRAAVEQLREWVTRGDEPPRADRIEREIGDDGTTTLMRDEHGNAKGGLRLPPIDVPVATYDARSCGLTGRTDRFDDETLGDLYPSNGAYVGQMRAAAARAVARGHLRQDDADELVRRAEESPVGE